MIIEPFEQQLELIKHTLNDTTTVIVYGGGIRGGKTFGAFIADFLYLKKYPGSRAAVVRDSTPTLYRNTIPSYNKLTPVKQISNIQQLQTPIKYRNSELFFFGENYDHDKDLNRWKGLEVNLIHLEEFNELQEASFDKAIERAGAWIIPNQSNQPPPKIIATCNPSNGWVKDRIYDKWRNGTLPKGWVFIPALLEDNPHLSEQYKESLKNLPEKHYRVFVKGEWEALEIESLFAYEFDHAKHVSKEVIQIDKYHDLILSFDFNIANTCLVQQIIGNEWRVLQEYHLKGGLENVCRQIKEDYDIYYPNYIINGDASGRSGSALTAGNANAYEIIRSVFDMSVKEVVRYVPLANPSHKNSYLLFNTILKNMGFRVNPTCKGFIKDLQNVQVKTQPSFVINKKDESLTHFLDPVRYTANSMLHHKLQELGIPN